GRGMCQWGSSFWGTDQTYTWILNHYYNPDSAAIPATITAVTNDNKIADDRTLTIAPNPVTGNTITIGYTLTGLSQAASIVLTDNFGQSARQQHVVLQQGLNQISVSTSGLKAGVYNVTVRLASGKGISKKLVIVK
ncbi:T9SS type A sorting domain-containing protein, partial [Niastella koreensis]